MKPAMTPEQAWAAYRPSPDNPWDTRKVLHLYRRAAFGATYAEQQHALQIGPHKAIDELISGRPGWDAFDREAAGLAETIASQSDALQMRAWWFHCMLYSPHPLREKMTLFWHNHFATSQAKVQSVRYMLGQNQLLRRHALGSFRTLLHAISEDPAMMVWLDTHLSTRRQPNENYARELMELFSLGIGNYTEQDIREAARAFTGWQIRHHRYYFNASEHDDGPKTVLGRSGRFNGHDIVDLCLDHPAAARFLARKLFRFFVSEEMTPDRELLEPLAQKLRSSNFDVRSAVETILRSQLFFAPIAYRSRVKSPVDFAVGIVHALEGRIGPTALAQATENLGQKIFYPPSVKGWDGGPAWINASTLIERHKLALAITSTEDSSFGDHCDPAALARKYQKNTDEQALTFFLELFLANDLHEQGRQALYDYLAQTRRGSFPPYWTDQDIQDHRVRTLCYLVLIQPEFQLD